MLDETAVHILGGGIGGTVGAVITCPLEVIKVRLQSSRGSALRSFSAPPPVFSSNYSYLAQEKQFLKISRLKNKSNDLEIDHHQRTIASSSTKLRNFFNSNIKFSPSHSTSFDRDLSKNTGFRRSVIIRSLVDIYRQEGMRALFKGLIPTLLGVLPSRGVYFCAYHKGQLFFEQYFPSGSSCVYLCSAAAGSITASSLTNPIWFVKTRLQLDSRPGRLPITVSQVIKNTWANEGIRGFYRGVNASYFGSLETALNFVIYEKFKSELLWWEYKRKQNLTIPTKTVVVSAQNNQSYQHNKISATYDANLSSTTQTIPQNASDLRGSLGGSKLTASRDMIFCMIASACSKAIAITVTYPHEVARTRLREEHGRYRGFFRTLRMVVDEEGISGLYRGMGTHYIRQVPNACIMIGTYEFVVFLLQSWHLTKDPNR